MCEAGPTSQEDPGRGAGAKDATEELGEPIGDWQDGGQPSDGRHVQAEGLVLQHCGGCEGQGVPGEVEAGIPAAQRSVLECYHIEGLHGDLVMLKPTSIPIRQAKPMGTLTVLS